MINEFIVANADYFILFVVLTGVFTIGAVVKGYITKKINEPKRGSPHGCADCLAMASVMTRLPKIEEKQESLRRNDLPALSNQISKLQSSVDTLEKSVEKLFNLLEQDWLQKIDRLEGAFLKGARQVKSGGKSHHSGTRAKS